jgi:signal transduction histidine kinase
VPRGLTLRVLIASAVLVLAMGSTFVLLLLTFAAQREAAELAIHSRTVLLTADDLERLVVDVETDARDYVQTHDESFFQRWAASRQAIGPQSAGLEELAQVPGQHQTAVQITQAINSYIDGYSVPLVEEARRGDPAAGSIQATQEGRQRIDQIRTLFQTLETNERQLLTDRDTSSLARTRQTVIAASVGFGISIVLTLLVGTYWTRSIVRPVVRVADMANQLAGGDLSTRVPETGVGEMRNLERAFNQMGAVLERNHDELAQLVAEQGALRRVAILIAHGEPPAAVFTAVVEEAANVLDADAVRLLRREADESATVLANSGAESLLIPVGERILTDGQSAVLDAFETGRISSAKIFSGPPGSFGAFAQERGIHLALAAPIVVERRVWGVISVVSSRPRPMEEMRTRLAQFTDLVATVIANTQAREDLAASRARLVTASDETRRRIERNLHDGIQQRLVSLVLAMRVVEASMPKDLPQLREQVSEVVGELVGSLNELREISRGIHPAILSEGGLGPALKALAGRSALPVEVDVDIATRPVPSVEIAVYYVVAEGLTNATKHARASRVRIEVATRGEWLHIAIVDDGVGGADPTGGTGLVGLIDRVDAMGGRITITSPPGEGTQVRIELPLSNGDYARRMF